MINKNIFKSARHTSSYLSAGPVDGPLVMFFHGWPELSYSWRHQLKYFSEKGFHVIAPDMRGYGESTVHKNKADYSQREIVKDMVELFQSFNKDNVIIIGHDWGSETAWSMARHYPGLVKAVASLCVPYAMLELDVSESSLEKLINRNTYPKDLYPYGQWDYQVFYMKDFDKACADMDSDPYKMIKFVFRSGDPNTAGMPYPTSIITKNNGWLPEGGELPDIPIDNKILNEEDARKYAGYLEKNGFFGPNSWYVNHQDNKAFAEEADSIIDMPSLFIHATYDYVCDTTSTGAADKMREKCKNLTEKRIDSGHWMAQEKPEELNLILENWLKEV